VRGGKGGVFRREWGGDNSQDSRGGDRPIRPSAKGITERNQSQPPREGVINTAGERLLIFAVAGFTGSNENHLMHPPCQSVPKIGKNFLLLF
jgi:hypothetical protein